MALTNREVRRLLTAKNNLTFRLQLFELGCSKKMLTLISNKLSQ